MRTPDLHTADEALKLLKGYPIRKEEEGDEEFMARVYEARRSLKKKVLSSGGTVTRPLGKDLYELRDINALLNNTRIAA